MTRAYALAGRALLVVWIALCAAPALAAEAVPTEQDPVAAARAVKLSEQLRCLVYQNQTIAESNAELAVDLRRQVREQVAAGRSDDQIVQYMVDRYGDFVLYRPPLKATTVLLWAGPAVLLLVALIVMLRGRRARRATAAPAELTPEERARAAQLLAPESPRKAT